MKFPNILVTSARGALLYVMKHFCEPGLTEYSELTDTYAVISIQDTAHGGFGFELKPNQYCKDVLTLYFDDITKPQEGVQLISDAQANAIVQFLLAHIEDVDTLLIHCFAGISRSRAVERFAREMLGMPPATDNLYNEFVYAMLKQAWRSAYINSFAVIFLHEQDTMKAWLNNLDRARYYHGVLSENAVIIWNLPYEEAEDLAKAHHHRSFLFGTYQVDQVTVTHCKWSVLVKNKCRVRRAYIPLTVGKGQTWLDHAFQEQFSECLRQLRLSEEKLHNETASLLNQLAQRQNEMKCSDYSIMIMLHHASDEAYYAKGRYFARATLYHE